MLFKKRFSYFLNIIWIFLRDEWFFLLFFSLGAEGKCLCNGRCMVILYAYQGCHKTVGCFYSGLFKNFWVFWKLCCGFKRSLLSIKTTPQHLYFQMLKITFQSWMCFVIKCCGCCSTVYFQQVQNPAVHRWRWRGSTATCRAWSCSGMLHAMGDAEGPEQSAAMCCWLHCGFLAPLQCAQQNHSHSFNKWLLNKEYRNIMILY